MFTIGFNSYVCEGDKIECQADGFTVTARIYRDDCRDKPDERDEGFWPSHNPEAAGWVQPENYEAEKAKAERVMQAWLNDEWFYCGVVLTVAKHDVELVPTYAAALWGVDCNYPDSDNSYLMTVANELLPEALDLARAKLAQLRSPDDDADPDEPKAED
jgi:hypothetical protein